jgi:photosystem II stability/assembly factor-like uncharacterized protein
MLVRPLTLILALCALAGCGGGAGAASDPGSGVATPRPTTEIGSVDVDPSDGSLLIGSSIGTYRLPAGAEKAEPVASTMAAGGRSGPLNDLVVRFAGPDDVLASGHSRGGTLPVNIGLVRSADDGRTWEPVSGLDEADYHDLEIAGERIVALRVDKLDVQVSHDGGRTFKEQAAPAAARALDIAVNPGDPEQWAVGTEQGTFISTNSGGSWRQRDTTSGARVAWVRPDALYSAGLDGKVRLSGDGGRSWREVGTVGAGPKDFTAGPDGELYAYVAGGKIRRSTDGGRTWAHLTKLL